MILSGTTRQPNERFTPLDLRATEYASAMAPAGGGQPAIPGAVLARLRAHRSRGLELDADRTRLVLAVHLMEPRPSDDHRDTGPARPCDVGDDWALLVVAAGDPSTHTTGRHGGALVLGSQRALWSTSHHASARSKASGPTG